MKRAKVSAIYEEESWIKSDYCDTGLDEETGIEEMSSPSNLSNSFFTLDGRHLDGKPMTKGMFISNGQKILIK